MAKSQSAEKAPLAKAPTVAEAMKQSAAAAQEAIAVARAGEKAMVDEVSNAMHAAETATKQSMAQTAKADGAVINSINSMSKAEDATSVGLAKANAAVEVAAEKATHAVGVEAVDAGRKSVVAMTMFPDQINTDEESGSAQIDTAVAN